MSLFGSLAPVLGMAGGALIGGPVGAAAGGALGGAVAGNEKHKQQLDRQHKTAELASATARYSPWTHMTPGNIDWAGSDVDAIGGGALAGGMTGYSLGSSFAGKPAPLGIDPGVSKVGGASAGGYDPNMMQNSPWPSMYGNNNAYLKG